MKLKYLLFFLLLSSNFIFSQEKVIESNDKEVVLPVTAAKVAQNGKVENGAYTCFKFDWKIKIPEGYGVTVMQNPTYLIGFEVDKRNNFSSSFESLAGTQITSLEDHKNFIVQLFNDTYSKIETLKFDVSSLNMKIGNYDFYKVQTRLYDYKTNELLITQDLYNSFINNHLFSVNVNYNNPNIGKLLTANFLSSLSN